MENIINRYRNVTILVAILFAQVLGLAIQVKRSNDDESSRLIRIWAIEAVTPLEKAIVWFQSGTSNLWHGYIYLRGVRQENRDLKQQVETLRLEQVRLAEDARQARRLQALLGFKEQYITQTMAAQVIGLSGSAQSRLFFIDKGSNDGIARDMAVISADGVVGKVLHVYGSTAQVLMINDQSSGVGVMTETSRLQGVVRGMPNGTVVLDHIMNDEVVQPGEKVLTQGGDQIFPKGLLVGTISKVEHGRDLFLNIQVKPSADLGKLEEVLVITKQEDREPEAADNSVVRAVDILEKKLPSVPDKPVTSPVGPGAAVSVTTTQKSPQTKTNANVVTPSAAKTGTVKTAPVAKPTAEPETTTAAPAVTNPTLQDQPQ